MIKSVNQVLARAEDLITRIENLLPATHEIAWSDSTAFRWKKTLAGGYLQAVTHPHRIQLNDLKGVDAQKALLDRNTQQFLQGYPANNVLLTGSRGTGKSSLIKALLTDYADKGLRLIEVDKQHLVDLPEIVSLLNNRPERFIIFCDDLSFEADDPGYKALKVVLDGSIAACDNVVVYATSNRRHLMPEFMRENLETMHRDGEIHPGEATEEKISLSERFGLWLSFYPFDQDEYLKIVEHWLSVLQPPAHDYAAMREEALRFALSRGSRSGRVAWQFAKDWAGRLSLASKSKT